MAELPTGTVTFLFVDVEGSAALWEQHPEAMIAALARQEGLLRQAVVAHGGHVFKTMGDAVCAAFRTAPDAVAAALDARRALLAESWGDLAAPRTRMALHTGSVEARDGDYFGPPVSRVGRLLAAGRGGQTLLSAAVQELVRDHLPADVDLRDLGEHRLKDLVRPERVFLLLHPDLPADFSPLRTLDSRPNNLPVQPTPLIGREREVEAGRARLLRDDVHLLTLTGPGGTGKTRLGLQIAAELLDHFEHGAFFVPLALISDPRLVASAIAQVLGVRDAGGWPLLESIKDSLRDKQLLLVLDNFEQVLEAAPLVADLLTAGPRLKVLVTSRALLHLRGEHEFPVPPLALPDAKRLPPAGALSQYAAVALFIERAAAVKAEFAVTNENAPAVAEICHRLDGLPLAIELAAARIRLLPPPAMLARLGRRLPFLTGGARDLPARQQTLRGTIEWSYDLLDTAEQRLFRWLGVFVGGCTLEAVEAVCGPRVSGVGDRPSGSAEDVSHAFDARDPTPDTLDAVCSLVDKSLVQAAEQPDGSPRFGMLETIREYALERLEASGEAQALRRRHAEYYLALAEEAEPPFWEGGEDGAWLAQLEQEHDNLRAVLAWSQSDVGDAEIGLRLAGALWWFWFVHSHYSEGRRWLETTLAVSSHAPAALRAKALTAAGQLVRVQGDYGRGAALLEEAAALCRSLGDTRGLARALVELGFAFLFQGDDRRATALWQESLALSRASGHRWAVATSLHGLGRAAEFRGDYAGAAALLEESLALFRELGNTWYTAWSLRYLGRVVEVQGDEVRAAALLEESLALFRQQDNKPGIAWALQNLGRVARARGDHRRATALHLESLALAREMGQKREIAEYLEGLAGLAAEQEQPERAARLFGSAEALRRSIGAPLPPSDRAAYERDLAVARAGLAEDAFAAAWAEGLAMPLDRAIDDALQAGAPETAGHPEPEPAPAVRQPGLLTPREREVAALIARGLTNRQIAEELVIGERTAESHAASILNKLGLASRTQVAVWAIDQGLLAPAD